MEDERRVDWDIVDDELYQIPAVCLLLHAA